MSEPIFMKDSIMSPKAILTEYFIDIPPISNTNTAASQNVGGITSVILEFLN
jgi:hypothetical protein